MTATTLVRRSLRPEDIPPEFAGTPAAYLSSLFEAGGDGTVILLAPNSIWELEDKLMIAVNNAELATDGYPTDMDLYAQVHTVGDSEATAVFFHNTKRVKISHLTFDGRRSDKGWIEGGGPIIACGGHAAKDPVVQHCILRHPRGWSCLHVIETCDGARVIGNKVGPAGLPAPCGPWADGLSIACRNGLIAGNEIVDATDGAIVLFGAPGTVCTGNTIIAKTQNCLGAINMVDAMPYEGNYTNTRVFNNLIQTTPEAYIKLGIGIGPLTWCPSWCTINKGGQVHDNVFGPGRFGYAIGMSGCREFEVQGNRLAAGAHFGGDLSSMPEPLNAPPMAFLLDSQPGQVENCEVQPDFIRGRACCLIGIEDRPPRKLTFAAGQLTLCSTGPPIVLERVKIWLDPSGELRVMCNSTSRVMWSSGSRGSTTGARLGLEENGHLTIRELSTGRVVWDPVEHLDNEVPIGRATLTVADESPFLALWSECNSLLWASEYVFRKGGLELGPNQFICIAPPSNRCQPPPIPPRIGNLANQITHSLHVSSPPPIPRRPMRPAFIMLDPNTSNLVIHHGNHPHRPHGNVVWASDLLGGLPKQICSRAQNGCETKCVFQGGDGNLVTYANPDDEKPQERRAIWASGTVCEEIRIVYNDTTTGGEGVKILFLGGGGEVVKQIPERFPM